MVAGATSQLTIIASLQDRLSKPLLGIQRSTGQLEKHFTKLSGAIQNAFQFYIRYRIFNLINQGISAVESAIPGLIARGQEWAKTVDDISDSSGLAAEKSSLLAGIVQTMTGNAEGLTKALGALSQAAVNHGDVMRRYGIDTRTTNGALLDSWTILQNVRRALSDVGNGFITTAAARDLLSRGSQTLIDFLTMSDAQFKLLTKDVKESGVIMSEAGHKAAEDWQRTQQRFELTITGIANQVTTAVQPLLTRLVDGITNYLRKNMAQIVGFVTGVISFVAGAIAGFLGIDISGAVKTMAEQMDALAEGTNKRERALSRAAKTKQQQTASEDGYTVALNRQIEAIDRQLAAMSKADDAEAARREQAQLLKDISEAKKQLRDLRGESIFAAGMSAAEAELARQAQAADIIDAQKTVHEAQQKLAQQERDTARANQRRELEERKVALQRRLADHMKAVADAAKKEQQVLSQVFGKDKGGIGDIPASIQKVMAEAKKGLLQQDIGKKWGEDFRATLEGFFKDLNDPTTGLGAAFSTLAGIAKAVADNWQLVAAAGAAIIALNLAQSLLAFGLAVTAATAKLALPMPGGGTGGLPGSPMPVGRGIMGLLVPAAAALAAAGFHEMLTHPGQFDTSKAVPVGNRTQWGPFLPPGWLVDLSKNVPDLARSAQDTANSVHDFLFPSGKGASPLTQVERHTAGIADLLAPAAGRTIAQQLSQVATNTAGLNTNVPWGIANITLNVDGRTVMTMFGIPIRRSNSTTRISPTQ